eukprot:m.227424 g.227424  ORF g.227424 m.227424 type:complete len:452 (-) comp15973_c0_seq1:1071-2426(-)
MDALQQETVFFEAEAVSSVTRPMAFPSAPSFKRNDDNINTKSKPTTKSKPKANPNSKLEREVELLRQALKEAVKGQRRELAEQRVIQARLEAEKLFLQNAMYDQIPNKIDHDLAAEQISDAINESLKIGAKKKARESFDDNMLNEALEMEDDYEKAATLARRKAADIRNAKIAKLREQERILSVQEQLVAKQIALDKAAQDPQTSNEEQEQVRKEKQLLEAEEAKEKRLLQQREADLVQQEQKKVFQEPTLSAAELRQKKIEEAERLAIAEVTQENLDTTAPTEYGKTTLSRNSHMSGKSEANSLASNSSTINGTYKINHSRAGSRAGDSQSPTNQDALADTRVIMPDADYLLSMIMMGIDESSEQQDEAGRRFHLNGEEIPVYREADVAQNPFDSRPGQLIGGGSGTLTRQQQTASAISRRKAEVENRRKEAHMRSLDRKGTVPSSETAF